MKHSESELISVFKYIMEKKALEFLIAFSQ